MAASNRKVGSLTPQDRQQITANRAAQFGDRNGVSTYSLIIGQKYIHGYKQNGPSKDLEGNHVP
jgi:hypothetical protein